MRATVTDRKLAAILSADVVGYSRLMAEDEESTVRILGDYREQVDLLVRQHRGRLVDFTGDNFLAEFPTALDAVQSAVEVQRVLAGRNAELPDDRKMEFRIGLHMGDIRVEGDRIFGDGVNIAARLESLAAPGGICISATVHEQVRSKLQVTYEDLGDQTVKNIPDQVHVYRVRLEAPEKTAARRPLRRGAVVAAMVVLLSVLAVAGWRWFEATQSARSGTPTPSELTVPGFSGRPAIAVLAFDNLSGDPEQEYFADGIAEDLISRLSAWRRYPVIARNSSFVYKGRAVDVKQVSRELGVRYVVEGSVRRSGESVRITAQLIDATTGHHVWAENYDRKMSEIFALQDEISLAIATAVSPELQTWEMQRVARSEPQNLDAWDRMQQGWWHISQLTPEGNQRAQALYRSAIELDPLLAPAWTGLAWTYYNFIFFDVEANELNAAEMLSSAERAAELDPQDPLALLVRGAAYGMAGDIGGMRADIARALGQNPSEPMAHYWTAVVLTASGRPDEAIVHLERAMRLSPRDPWFFLFLESIAAAHFKEKRYAEAVESALASVRHRPDYSFSRALLAASYAWTGQLEKGRSALRAVLAESPDFSIANVRAAYAFSDPEFVDRLVEGLRRAGLEG
jgi:adenylate cyclase